MDSQFCCSIAVIKIVLFLFDDYELDNRYFYNSFYDNNCRILHV